MEYDDANKKRRYTGSISGYDVITTEVDPNIYPHSEHDYTLPEFLARLRDLKSTINVQRLMDIMKMISEHINDFNNPHHTTLEKLGTDVIRELYKKYLLFTGSSSDDVNELMFLKIIFQYVRIADLATTLYGTARDQIPTVYGMAKYVDKHDKDPDAHSNIFNKLFPGDPVYTAPSFAMYGYIGCPESIVTVERSTPMCYIDNVGRIAIAAKNTLPSDFTHGEGAFPIFGTLTNLITGNANITGSTIWTTENVLMNQRPDLQDNLLTSDLTGTYLKLFDTLDSSPVEHNLIYTSGSTYTAGRYYTVSCFVKSDPGNTKSFGIRFPNVFAEPYSFVHFNLVEKKIFKHASIPDVDLIAGIVEVANGWYRVWATYRVAAVQTISFKFYPLDIYDGDFTYRGSGTEALNIAYPQLTQTAYMTPPLISTVSNTLNATAVYINLEKLYLQGFNLSAGTFVIDITYPHGNASPTVQNVFDVVSETNVAGLNGRFPTNHQNRMYTVISDKNGGTLGTKYLNCNLNANFARFVIGYSATGYLTGTSANDASVLPEYVVKTTPVNEEMAKLFIGCDRNKSASTMLNGYLRKIVYYPIFITPRQGLFLLKE